jgi:hypothetical protein
MSAPSRAGRPRAPALRLALLILLGWVCLAGPAAAQAPDGADATYTLTWWTADAGGASYRAAGSYALGGTAGQPDAAPERSGSNGSVVYTLRAGFWQPSCVAAAVVTTITRAVGNPNTVTLSWTHITPNQTYQVHRATMPYFTPAAGTLQETVTAGPWSDDEVVIGDPGTNYTYLVRATCGAAYADPARVGEFDFRLVPGN